MSGANRLPAAQRNRALAPYRPIATAVCVRRRATPVASPGESGAYDQRAAGVGAGMRHSERFSNGYAHRRGKVAGK
ncbi:MAG: hypothetical protein NZ699_02120 [Roseiflexus sp.]|nr:hypothetical protein [Roseiflexus sp.]MCS7287908.1 hypothetical protein [Roseiflexus sp.]MDW8144850.1 hypothetical protein [Roseiflexaceae bacterium]MDW8233021.1 hypothetical protein [Roseiflexaceae bacterium]